MSFIRPEARAAVQRWREALLGAGLAALGLWWALGMDGILHWLGYALLPLSAAVLVMGVQRARFRTPGQGPGVVQVTEGQIAYFGPHTGGVVALSELRRVALDPSGRPALWVLSQPGQPPLSIPVTAAGAEALLDAFAALPGFSTAQAIDCLRRQGTAQRLVWERPGRNANRLSGPH